MEEILPLPQSVPMNRLPDPTRIAPMTRRVIVWAVVLLVFAGLFVLVLRTQNTPQAAAQSAKRGAAGGAVSVIPATAQKSNIGVYLEAIGTVTPVYTSSITSQVTGLVMAVHYREGQLVHKGDPLIDIDPRPFQAQLAQAEGTLEKDTQMLAQASMDLERYRAAWATERHRQADPRRPGKARAAGSGTGEDRPGHGAVRQGATRSTATSPRPSTAASDCG